MGGLAPAGPDRASARRAAGHWACARGAALSPLGGGLINQTWLVDGPDGRFVLQRVNPVFAPRIHHDIAAVTAHLEAAGLVTPTLRPADDGALWVDLDDGGVWRLLNHVDGVSVSRTDDPALVAEAAGLLGRFHRALADLEHRFLFVRPGVHDTDGHVAGLRQVADAGRGAPEHAAAVALADEIRAAAATLPPLPDGLPARVLHGDPKLDNVRFTRDGRALCLVDLDTLRRGPLAHDLGDAWRSWSNRAGEDEERADLDVGLVAAAARGYAREAADLLGPAEVDSLLVGLQRIALELSARFCRDAIEGRYFGWDPERFPTRAAHNLARARGQLDLWRQVRHHGGDLRAAVRDAFRPW